MLREAPRPAGEATMRKARWTLAAAIALASLAAGWWFGSPWWTLRRMREAAAAGDAQALASYIDFPALRASTRERLSRRLGPLGGLVGRSADAAERAPGVEPGSAAAATRKRSISPAPAPASSGSGAGEATSSSAATAWAGSSRKSG